MFKDKIEVSLDGKQVFYLFFGGAVLASLVFVLGVMVGRRVEARSHVDAIAQTETALDPLAALDTLSQSSRGEPLVFRSALAGGPAARERALRDLDQRGLLDTTLVMVTSEFGRTPKINADAGRDHWPKVFSAVLAGGGIKRGIAYGATNATATEPESDPLSPEDLATTVYRCLGIVADKELMAPGGRPIEIVKGGKVRDDLLV